MVVLDILTSISIKPDESWHAFFVLIVPFRDSVLTKLLKNALGGNSKTIMVSLCCFHVVSPTCIMFNLCIHYFCLCINSFF